MNADRRHRYAPTGLIVLLVVALMPGPLAAQSTEAARFFTQRPVGPVTFESVLQGPPPMPRGETLVVNPDRALEEPARAADWPSSFFYHFKVGNDRKLCSGTLIGGQTLITAAHCIPENQQIAVKFQGATIKSLECKTTDKFAHPASDGDIDACEQGGACAASRDVALCLLESPPSTPKLETVARDPALLGVGQRVRVTGFGCTARDQSGGTEGNRSVFSTGWVAVRRAPVPDRENFYVVAGAARDLQGALAAAVPSAVSEICPGDSGGGAYVMGLNPTSIEWRRLVAVNSAVRQRKENGNWVVKGPSFFVPLSAPPVVALLDKWEGSAGHAGICGIGDKPQPRCR